jgi:hypothetical protein
VGSLLLTALLVFAVKYRVLGSMAMNGIGG